MVINTVGTDTHHRRIEVLKSIEEFCESTGFYRATAGEIAGVEIQNQPLTAEIIESPPLLVWVTLARSFQLKVRNVDSIVQNNTPESVSPRGCDGERC